jgi:hypothetical protein
MSTALITPAVKAVLNDLNLWSSLGVRIAVIQATPDGGVEVGVASDAATAKEALGARYPFPVTCWLFE